MKYKDISYWIACDTELLAEYDGFEYPIVDYSYDHDYRFCMDKDGRYYSVSLNELDVCEIDVRDGKLIILLDVPENYVTDERDTDLGFIPEE